MPVATALLVILTAFGNSTAQEIEATLTVYTQRSEVRVEGRILNEDALSSSQPLVFLSDYAGIRLPHERIRNVKQDGRGWSYDVDLTPMTGPAAMAHVSWLTTSGGILMLADLLPKPRIKNKRRTAKLTLIIHDGSGATLPWTWSSVGTTERWQTEAYIIADTEKAVFFLKFVPVFSRKNADIHTNVRVRIAGDFTFDPLEVSELADEIYRRYEALFRGPLRPFIVALTKLPDGAPLGVWEADTRGTSVTIVSSDMPFKSQSLQRLHEQLRHEMFHLWIPEGVNLTGNYDWFYEGFALYQSLKLGVAVNRLRFEDYLDSLTKAYAIDRRLSGKASLINASKTRWSGDDNSVVYARGMLVAFLCDLAILEASKGKRSTDDIVREVYQKHGDTTTPQDGNAAIMAIMAQRPELVPIIERYVTGAEKLDWAAFLNATGLEATGGILKVVAKPTGRQKKLLDKLGYNNWRKLSSTRK